MNKTIKTMLALMAGAMVFAACSNDDTLENINEQTPSALKPMIFTASMEGQGGGTRAAIDGLDIKWTSGDKISIFDGSTENNGDQEFTLSDGSGTTSGTFTGTAAEATTYYALYPYAESKSENRTPTEEEVKAAAGDADYKIENWKKNWKTIYKKHPELLEQEMNAYEISPENQAIILAYLKGETLEIKSGVQRNESNQFEDVVLPAEQTATTGSADPNAMLMIAKSDDASTMEFKNVCAYVKVTPQFDCDAICLRSTDATKYLAGTVTIDYNEGTPTTTVTANGSNEVLLTGTITGGNTYYIAVRPETLSSGFTIEFLSKDKTHYYARTSSSSLALARNNVKNLGEFATDGKWSVSTPTSGTADGHDWKLISANPMLKIATELAIDNVLWGDVENNLSLWGGNWILPSKEDMAALFSANLVSDGTFSGQGVLKFNKFTLMPAGFWYWLSGVDSNSGRRDQYSISGSSYATNTPTEQAGIFYKYIGN
ncbi:MAG: hypothetical protein KBS99_02585 [Prevotellaceae bacterium]|nr:hypothetical protein [Candidatus Colivivens caballi]